MKRKTYLDPRKVLSKSEYDEYKEYQKRLRRRELREQLAKFKREAVYQRKVAKYRASSSGKVSSGVASALGFAKMGLSRSLYAKGTPNKTPLRTGRRGRPRGTVKYTDPKTGQPIGVYEYRKILSARHAREKAMALRNSAITPAQQEALRRIELRNQQARMSPETQIIPDTSGGVPMRDIMGEIDRASNLFE